MKRWSHLLILLWAMQAQGQHIDTLQNKLEAFYQQIPQERVFTEWNTDDLSLILFQKEFYQSKGYKDSLIINQLSLNQQDIGLHFRSNARYNLLKSALPNSDDFLRSRVNISAGLEWDVLKYGWRDRKIKNRQLKTELEIEQLSQQFQQDNNNYLHRYEYTTFVFNHFLLEELRWHHQLYNEQIQLYMEMYYLNLLPYTAIITLKKRQAEVAVKINEIEAINSVLDYELEVAPHELPIFDLNLKEIVAAYWQNSLSDTIAFKQKQHLQTAYQLKDEMTLGVYTHLQLFKSATDNEWITSPVVGVNMSIPLFHNKPKQQKSLYFEQKIIDEQLLVQKDNDLKTIHQLYSIYQDHLKAVKGLYYQLHFEKEKLQTALIHKKKAKQSSVISTFLHLNNILEIRREITLVQQQLYLVALQIFTTIGTHQLHQNSPMINNIPWKSVRSNQIAIILDTNKDLTDIQFFIQFLKRKDIQKIYLAGLGDKYALTRQLLELEGFELLSEVDKKDILEIHQFQNLKDLKSMIHQSQNLIVLKDLHELLALEKGSL